MSTGDRTVDRVTCLGCGCACDDIAIAVSGGRIADARNACALGRAWFGDGGVPGETRVQGRTASLERAVAEAARILVKAARPLVYLGGDVSCETQRETVAIADALRAPLDSIAATAAAGVLAAQRRGRAGATLGEIRQRADLIVFWAVDPGERYPRYAARYAVEPRGLETPEGRASRTVVAVDVGATRGPTDADARVAIAPPDEVDALGAMRATVQGRVASDDDRFGPLVELARRMMRARYVALVADGEPGAAGGTGADPDRAEALVALAQALNGPARCALSTLRAGGNRSGAEAVLTWQTGFPFATDFARGYPDYRPHAAAASLLGAGEIDAALLIGATAGVPDAVTGGLGKVATIVIGPRASAAPFRPAVAIDTGVAGIHEAGTAFRMDDVPLPLRPALEGGARSAATTVRALRERLAERDSP
jgi:formylmethanofuran dehydrogenase subunit B